MHSIDINEVNFTEIMTFLSVARTLNMSASANELFISQPAVSKRISRLEKTYGLVLFVRNKNGLRLTPAGKVFFEEMSASFRHIEEAYTKASIVQSGLVQEFTIGHDGFFDLPLLYEIVERFKTHCPNITVNVCLSKNESCEDIFTGRADILLRPDSSFKSLGNYIRSQHVSEFKFCILVANTNPISEKQNLSIDDIKDIPLIVAHIQSDSPYIVTIKNMFLKYGCIPKFEKSVPLDILCFQVLVTSGIAIASPSFWTRMNARAAAFFQNRIKTYPIQGEFYPVSFVWKTEGETPYIRKFLEIYNQVISEKENKHIVWESYNGYLSY